LKDDFYFKLNRTKNNKKTETMRRKKVTIMKLKDILSIRFFMIAAALFLILATAAIHVKAQTVFQVKDSVKEQFTIALPGGWSMYNQSEAITGKSSSFGVVIFSEHPLARPGEKFPDTTMLAQSDKGEMPSFFVDRIPAPKGMSCSNFSNRVAYDLGMGFRNDPIFNNQGLKIADGGLPVDYHSVQVAGCQGNQYNAKSKKNKLKWILDVRAVSDGRVIYLFYLRNPEENYAKNIDIFEKAIATLQLNAAK
jgi:hypothetical protein